MTGALLEFRQGALGDASPVVRIAAPANPMKACQSIAIDKTTGTIFALDAIEKAVYIWPARAGNDTPPFRHISGSRTQLVAPTAIAVDSKGALYVADAGAVPKVVVFAGFERGNTPPIRVITGYKTKLRAPQNIAVDEASGLIWVDVAPRLYGFRIDASGNAEPKKFLWPELCPSFTGLAVDGADRLYIACPVVQPAILVYAPGAGGRARPLQEIRVLASHRLRGIAVDYNGGASSSTIEVKVGAQPHLARLPKVAGFSGSMVVPGDPSHVGTTATITLSNVAPAGSNLQLKTAHDAPVYQPLLYINLNADDAAQLANSVGISIFVPNGTPTQSTAFYLSVFDLANRAKEFLVGPGTYTNGVVNFQTSSQALTFTSGDSYEFVIFAVPSTVATPTPVPVPSGLVEYPQPPDYGTFGIAAGPDNNLWFLEGSYSSAGFITKMTPSGVVTRYVLSNRVSWVTEHAVTVGPDDNIWFAEDAEGYPSTKGLGVITTSGTLTEFDNFLNGFGILATGPDGNIWGGGTAISTSGSVVRTLNLGPSGSVSQYAHSPDGSLWSAVQVVGANNYLGKLTADGTYTQVPVKGNPHLNGFTFAGGYFWAGDGGDNLLQISGSGAVTRHFIASKAEIEWLTTAPDGSLWFVEPLMGAIGHADSSGHLLAQYVLPPPNPNPSTITIGPDGNPWFVSDGGVVGTIRLH